MNRMQAGLSQKTKIGIVGCGAIGSALALAIDRGDIRGATLAGLSDHLREHAVQLAGRLRHRVPVLTLAALIQRCHLVVETANAAVVPALLKQAIRKQRDLLIMSSGGMRGQETLLKKARRAGCRIHFPSGALIGIDGIKAISLLPVRKVTLTTQKPPQGFEGAPFIVRHRIRLDTLRRRRLLFRGNVEEALKGFPRNINVAQTLVLAGIDPRRLSVRLFADPSTTRNHHEIVAEGAFGKVTVRAENVPSRKNPGTSQLAVVSALAALKSFFDPVRVGT